MGKEKRSAKFFRKLKYFFRYQFTVPFKAIYYFFYFMKYPFWQPRNVWTGKKCWTFTEYNEISPGWRNAFGKQLTKDLKAALKEAKQLKSFYFLQIKEKWGGLCLYGTATTEKVNKILHHYENLSICYCEDCGKPARYKRLGGWVGYVCSECFNKQLAQWNPEATLAEKYRIKSEHRLRVADIPVHKTYVDGKARIVDIGINYKKMWAIKNKNCPNRKEVKDK